MRFLLEQDGYQIRKWLGQGLRGPSYVAADPQGELVAVKELQVRQLGAPNGAELDPKLEKTIQALKNLSHPSVARVRDVILRDGLAYIIEDYLRGYEPLDQILARQHFLDPQDAWKLGCQLCHGLHFAHERGFVHQRLRPQDILVDEQGAEVAITDLGAMTLIAQLVPRLDRKPWADDAIDPAWVAGVDPSPTCDTYSLGVILRSSLERGPEWNARDSALRAEIRRFAFLEVDRDLAELEGALRPVTRRSREAVQWLHLRRVITDAAHLAPEDRFATAQELGKALAAARTTDEYQLDEAVAAKPAPAATPAPLKTNLLRDAVAFCEKCGRPATGGEVECLACGENLPEPVASAEANVQYEVNLQEMRDWFAERGDELASAGKTTAAEMAYRLSAFRQPDSARTWSDLGDMYCINRRFPLALEAYRKACELNPRDPATHMDLGLALLANRQAVEAQKEFTWVLNQPLTAEVRLRAAVQLGAAFAAQNRHAEAIDIWRKCLQERPFDLGIHCSLAASYLAQTNYARAYEHLKMAIRANPESMEAQRALRRLDRKQARAAARWDTRGITLIRVPLFLFCLLFGWFGLIVYGIATAVWEVYTRVDLVELWYRLRERRRERRKRKRDMPAGGLYET